MRPFRLLPFIPAVVLTSCTTPAPTGSDDPAPSPPAVSGKNPLIGKWKFDAMASTVHTVTFQANSGSLGRFDEQTKRLSAASEGSTVEFTASTMTLTIQDGRTISTPYSLKSADGTGNCTIIDNEGRSSKYSVSGNQLINPAPDLHFVSVYRRM